MENCSSSKVLVALVSSGITAIFMYFGNTYTADIDYKKAQMERDAIKQENQALQKSVMIAERNNAVSTVKAGIFQIQTLANGIVDNNTYESKIHESAKVFETTSKALATLDVPLDVTKDYSALQVGYNHLASSVKRHSEAVYYHQEDEAKIAYDEYVSNWYDLQNLSLSLINKMNLLAWKE